MSPTPRQRIKNKAPSKNILDAAQDLRRLEVLYDLDLITSNEKTAEKKAVERYLGINHDYQKPKPVSPVVAAKPQTVQPPKKEVAEVKNIQQDVAPQTPNEIVSVTDAVTPAAALVDELKSIETPQVSNPF